VTIVVDHDGILYRIGVCELEVCWGPTHCLRSVLSIHLYHCVVDLLSILVHYPYLEGVRLRGESYHIHIGRYCHSYSLFWDLNATWLEMDCYVPICVGDEWLSVKIYRSVVWCPVRPQNLNLVRGLDERGTCPYYWPQNEYQNEGCHNWERRDTPGFYSAHNPINRDPSFRKCFHKFVVLVFEAEVPVFYLLKQRIVPTHVLKYTSFLFIRCPVVVTLIPYRRSRYLRVWRICVPRTWSTPYPHFLDIADTWFFHSTIAPCIPVSSDPTLRSSHFRQILLQVSGYLAYR